MKKLSSFLVAVVACCLLLTTPSLAVELLGSGTCGIDGENLVWVLDKNGVLTISGTGAMETDPTVFYENSSITTVVIEEGVTSIGNDAFWNCPCLATVVLPGSMAIIGEYAFSGCTSLSSIIIPDGVTTIGDYAFSGCSSLDSITIPGNVETVGNHAFSSCSNLSSATICNGVTEIGDYAFIGCSNLTSVTLPDSVDVISDYMFYSCQNLNSITIPNGVTSIGTRAFSGCSNLTLLDIPESVTEIGPCAFYGCSSLTSVVIPECVTSIEGSTFYNCSNLVSITIPNGVTTISNAAFRKCSNLSYITIPASITSIGDYAFSNCSLLTDIYFAGSEEDWSAALSVHSSDIPSNTTIHYNSTGPLMPDVPTISVSTRTSDGKPKICWSAVENAAGYEVYISATKDGQYRHLYTASATKLNVTHIGAEVGESYFYKVRSINGSAKSAFSDAKRGWCDLPRPTVTVTTRASDGKPTISWAAIEGATGYEVWYSGSKSGTYIKLYTASATKLSVTHTGAAVGNDYFYKVKAIYSDDTSCNSAFSAIKGVWVDLKRPTIKVVNSASSGKPVISWGKVDYAVGYKVYCATGSSTGTYKLIYSTTNPDKLSVTHVGAKAGEAYFYKVVAVHKNSKCTSAYSTAKGVYCDLARPTLTVELSSTGKPYIKWCPVDGADSYYVYYSVDSNNYDLLFIAPADRLYCTHIGAKAGVTYSYKMVAVCAATSKSNSAYSLVKHFMFE